MSSNAERRSFRTYRRSRSPRTRRTSSVSTRPSSMAWRTWVSSVTSTSPPCSTTSRSVTMPTSSTYVQPLLNQPISMFAHRILDFNSSSSSSSSSDLLWPVLGGGEPLQEAPRVHPGDHRHLPRSPEGQGGSSHLRHLRRCLQGHAQHQAEPVHAHHVRPPLDSSCLALTLSRSVLSRPPIDNYPLIPQICEEL